MYNSKNISSPKDDPKSRVNNNFDLNIDTLTLNRGNSSYSKQKKGQTAKSCSNFFIKRRKSENKYN